MNKKTARKLRKFANGDPVAYESMKRRWKKARNPERIIASRVIEQTIANRAEFTSQNGN